MECTTRKTKYTPKKRLCCNDKLGQQTRRGGRGVKEDNVGCQCVIKEGMRAITVIDKR